MLINEDGTVLLRQDEIKLALALVLDRSDDPGWVGGQLDALRSGLALSLFGENAVHVGTADIQSLKNESYAEWRRG